MPYSPQTPTFLSGELPGEEIALDFFETPSLSQPSQAPASSPAASAPCLLAAAAAWPQGPWAALG